MIETKQELFDKVWQGFVAQNWQRSATPEGACRYRGPNGLKCAVGVLVPDDKYDKNMEGASLTADTPNGEKVREIVDDLVHSDLFGLLHALQAAHDTSSDEVPEWGLKQSIVEVGQDHKLVIPRC